MKKEFCVQLFMVILAGFLIVSCDNLKQEQSNVYSKNENSPSQAVVKYLNNSIDGDSRSVRESIARTPASFWLQCRSNNDITKKTSDDTQSKETEKKWEDGYYDLTESTSEYIKTNKVKLLSTIEERIFNDEAIVLVNAGNQYQKQNMAFYLTWKDGQWKIFLVNSNNDSSPISYKFAEERPLCQTQNN